VEWGRLRDRTVRDSRFESERSRSPPSVRQRYAGLPSGATICWRISTFPVWSDRTPTIALSVSFPVLRIKSILSPELIQTFLKYWSYLGSPTHNSEISRPFFQRKSGRFWHLWANSGYEKVVFSRTKLKTLAEV